MSWGNVQIFKKMKTPMHLNILGNVLSKNYEVR